MQAVADLLRIGTSVACTGWNYAKTRKRFYRSGLRQLQRAADVWLKEEKHRSWYQEHFLCWTTACDVADHILRCTVVAADGAQQRCIDRAEQKARVFAPRTRHRCTGNSFSRQSLCPHPHLGALPHFSREPSFVIQLGDLIDGRNAPEHSDVALRATKAELVRLSDAMPLGVLSVLGNHELYNFRKERWAQEVMFYLDVRDIILHSCSQVSLRHMNLTSFVSNRARARPHWFESNHVCCNTARVPARTCSCFTTRQLQ